MSSYVYYTVMKSTSIVASEKNIAVQNAVYTNGSDGGKGYYARCKSLPMSPT